MPKQKSKDQVLFQTEVLLLEMHHKKVVFKMANSVYMGCNHRFSEC